MLFILAINIDGQCLSLSVIHKAILYLLLFNRTITKHLYTPLSNQGTLMIEMEYADGGTLRDKIIEAGSTHFSEADILWWVALMCAISELLVIRYPSM